jgi:hypothetical protein
MDCITLVGRIDAHEPIMSPTFKRKLLQLLARIIANEVVRHLVRWAFDQLLPA